MKESYSITNNLLIEVDVLTNRLKNIKQSYKTIYYKGLKERLFSENKDIFNRINEIYKIAKHLKKTNYKEFNFSNLLVEKTERALKQNKFESNLFFL
ncbi:hypothetical protein [uncultured Prochlorococcus sp.]|uniref:hypothetical protein n=1 Tax=uncultured Prochlorococcus sp. TaxID=159733 RepID=UPI002583A541|nr:hypothetical protein [uncultured Prochlorococcus sp.]